MVDEDFQAKCQRLNNKILELIVAFTQENGAVIQNIEIAPEIEQMGETGMSRVNYNMKVDYAYGTNSPNPGEVEEQTNPQ